MGIVPLRDILYILPMEDPPLSPSGLIYVETKRSIDQGIVKYRGPKTSGEIKVGDHVFFSHWSGNEVVLEGEGRLMLLREQDIDLVVNDSPFNHTLTIPQIQRGIEEAAVELSIQLNEHDQAILRRLRDRLMEHLEFQFQRELYF